ncbi:ABC transporter substrate-binding protein [Acetobacter lambici]|uniref:ABC transporter substrate-binding protein n=1 Tax=Acetobacter lambici TaxID=1332824 RepID=A0ABT1F094_9PROT|nr:ABC transporter substrate-binding protein [Acetobacter lambici]MCP1242405.1 ABC transporter substrate-binding protein [Acetobacter lambici]MCP1258627.1 ABC transporter substrate-binding protein [Acetobacter lambici]NHO56885.1 ABC transporter substrate-binding protein [Acetobacter lambici]
MSAPVSSPLSRRALLWGAGGCVAAGGVVLLTRQRHPRTPRKQPDGVYRKLKIGWPEAAMSPVLAAALEKNFFAQYNLDVDPLPNIHNGQEALAALTEQKTSYAVAPALTWLQHLHAGLPAHLVMGVQSGSRRLLVRRSSGITRLDQLMGRNVAVPDQNAADKLFFCIMMRRKGMDALTHINWVDLPIQQIEQALHDQKIDAVVTHDPDAWSLLQNHPDLVYELVGSDTGHYAARTSLILGVADTAQEKDPTAATALVLALRDAALWVNTHRDDAATLIADNAAGLPATSARNMLRNEPVIRPLMGRGLREQIAQYCDELQLVGMMADGEDSTALARSYTLNVLHE